MASTLPAARHTDTPEMFFEEKQHSHLSALIGAHPPHRPTVNRQHAPSFSHSNKANEEEALWAHKMLLSFQRTQYFSQFKAVPSPRISQLGRSVAFTNCKPLLIHFQTTRSLEGNPLQLVSDHRLTKSSLRNPDDR